MRGCNPLSVFGIRRSRTTDIGRERCAVSNRAYGKRPFGLRSPVCRLRSPDRNRYPFGIRRSRTTDIGREYGAVSNRAYGKRPFGLRSPVRRLRSPDRNHARLKTAPTGNARSGWGPPSVGCDRQIATATRSGSGDPELQTLAVNMARFQTAPTGTARSGSGDPELQTLISLGPLGP